MSDSLTLDQVRHVARLARLALDEGQLDTFRDQLTSILDHLARLNEIDVEGVAPLAHPHEYHSRLDDDEVGETLPVASVLGLAPAVEDAWLAVPKVLDDQGGSTDRTSG